MTTPGTRTIVVGVDGSADADAALAWAARHARLAGADLVLLHAVAVPSMAGIGWTLDATLESGRLLKALAIEGEKIVARARSGIIGRHRQLTVRTEVVTGDPRQVLLDRGAGAYLVVVGSHGRGPVRSLLLGSVGTALARHATAPTVVVRGATTRTGGVLAGIACAESAAPVLELATEYAELHGLPLTALTAVPAGVSGTVPAGLVGPAPHDVDAVLAMLTEATEQVRSGHPDVRLHLEAVHGRPVEAIVRAAGDASLVVVGTSRHRVGDDAVATVERASCPVAVVPVPEPAACQGS